MIFKKNYEYIYADVKICPAGDYDKRGGYNYLNTPAYGKAKSLPWKKGIRSKRTV